MNTMKRAHEIRREAARKWGCSASEIVFAECLKMAHRGERIEKMKGTEKQVTWATDIKLDAEHHVLQTCNDAAEAAKTPAQAQVMRSIVDLVLSIDDASWWIEHRSAVQGMLTTGIDMDGTQHTERDTSSATERAVALTRILPTEQRERLIAAAKAAS